jgi:hypothetical protein
VIEAAEVDSEMTAIQTIMPLREISPGSHRKTK